MPLKLRGDAPPSASRRRRRYVATQRAVHRDAVGGTLGHALKGQKLLAQGNALGYCGCKPVALKGQKLSSRDNIL